MANRISVDLVKFFNSVPHGSDAKHIDIILNTTTLVEYIHTLKQRSLAPSTIIDKLRNLRLCIEYLSTSTTKSQVNISSKCEATLKWLKKRAKVLRKDVRVQQFSNAMKGENEIDNAGNPRDFWSNADVKKEVYTILKRQRPVIILPTMNTRLCWHIWQPFSYTRTARGQGWLKT